MDGFADLRMYESALEEVRALEPEGESDRFKILSKELEILRRMEDWPTVAAVARRAVSECINYGDLYLEGALGIRQCEGVSPALEFLMSGESCLAWTPEFWFLRGCYECVLGNLEEAERCVGMAMGSGQEQYEERANTDEDLKQLWGNWGDEEEN